MSDELYEHIRELAKFKLEFIDENDNYYKMDSYIKSIDGGCMLISPPENQEQEKIINIPENAEVNLIFPMDKGVLIAQCTVLGKELGPQPGIQISFPHNTRVLERREFIRVPIKLRVEIIYFSDQSYLEKNSFFAITKNLSANGMAFYHKEPIEDYYDLRAKIYLNDENPKPIELQHELVYSQKVKIKNELIFLTATTFTSLSEPDSARIVKECFKYQVRHKKIKNY